MWYWNCSLNRTCCFVITEENSKSFWSNLLLTLLNCQLGGVNSSKASQVCHIKVYGSNYWRKHRQTIHFFQKIMENIMIIPWSWYQSWKTWYSYHDHAMNHDDHAKKQGCHAVIKAWSWPFSQISLWTCRNKWVLRKPIFVEYCVYCARSGLSRILGCLCFTWKFEPFQLGVIS